MREKRNRGKYHSTVSETKSRPIRHHEFRLLRRAVRSFGLYVHRENAVLLITDTSSLKDVAKVRFTVSSPDQIAPFLAGLRFAVVCKINPCEVCSEITAIDDERSTRARIVLACAYARQRWCWPDDLAIATLVRRFDMNGAPFMDVRTLVDERADFDGLEDPFEPGGVWEGKPKPNGSIKLLRGWAVGILGTNIVKLQTQLASRKYPHQRCWLLDIPGFERVMIPSLGTAQMIRLALAAWGFAPSASSRRLTGRPYVAR